MEGKGSFPIPQHNTESTLRYASIGAVLMSPKVVDGIRGTSGLWKHGHTYQVSLYYYPILQVSC